MAFVHTLCHRLLKSNTLITKKSHFKKDMLVLSWIKLNPKIEKCNVPRSYQYFLCMEWPQNGNLYYYQKSARINQKMTNKYLDTRHLYDQILLETCNIFCHLRISTRLYAPEIVDIVISLLPLWAYEDKRKRVADQH